MCENDLVLRIPTVVYRTAHGKSSLTLEFKKIHEYLQIDEVSAARLRKYFPQKPDSVRPPKIRRRLDYPRLAKEYTDLIETGICKNQRRWQE